jgi:glycosyltransferase involved in cell wall biosynthesis
MTSSFYPPYHVGGACIHVKYLAEQLARRGHEVHVMHSLDAYRIKRGKHLPVQKEREHINVYIHTLESPLKKLDPLIVYTLGTSFHVRKKFLEIVKSTHPDVVHNHNISLLGYNILNKEGDYLSLYTAHDYWLICPTNNLLKNKEEVCRKKSCFSCAIKSGRPPQIWRSLRGFRKAIECIDLMITPSNYVRRRLAQEIGIKSITIPNFVPPPPGNISPVDDSNYFLFVGMLEIHKGILNLLELFKELRNEINAKLLIVGEGSLKNYVRRFIERNSLGKLISYIGFVDKKELYSLYRGASAVIMPSICPENAPLVALEALSVGTPIIASNIGGLPEIVGKVDNKLIFSDRVELKNLLLDFPKNKFPPSKIKEVYDKNFSSKAYIDKYIEAIQSIRA